MADCLSFLTSFLRRSPVRWNPQSWNRVPLERQIPGFPMVQAQRFSMYKRHQASGYRVRKHTCPAGPIGLPDITQVGKLLYFLHDTIICDGFTACHSSFNRVLQRMFMQMRLAALDKSMGNASRLRPATPFFLSHRSRILVHHLALVYCLCLHFLDCINGNFPRPCLV